MTSAQTIGIAAQRRTTDMTKAYKAPPDAQSDQRNSNKGTRGTNTSLYDKAQGNRGKQLDPRQQSPSGR